MVTTTNISSKNHYTFSTNELPPEHQLDAWCSESVPFLDITLPRDARRRDFPASVSALRLGGVMLCDTHRPPIEHGRRERQIKRDSLDHWIIAMCRGMHREQSFIMQENVPYVMSMGQPFRANEDGDRINWLALFIPRDTAPELTLALDAACDRPLTGVAGRIFAEHMLTLQKYLGDIDQADGDLITLATLALLGNAVRAYTTERTCNSGQRQQLGRGRIKALIRNELALATLTPDKVAGMAGMSRSKLYRLFEPMGGVMKFIQMERLRRAHQLLWDPNELRPIALIAEEVGFFDPSAFSRSFRQIYGCSPRDVRWSGAKLDRAGPNNSTQSKRETMLTLLGAL